MNIQAVTDITCRSEHTHPTEKGQLEGHPWSGKQRFLRPYSARVTISAVHGSHVAKIYRVGKLNAIGVLGQLLTTFRLRNHGVANIAILAQDLAFLAHVIAVMTAEATGIIEVANV